VNLTKPIKINKKITKLYKTTNLTILLVPKYSIVTIIIKGNLVALSLFVIVTNWECFGEHWVY